MSVINKMLKAELWRNLFLLWSRKKTPWKQTCWRVEMWFCVCWWAII